MAELQLLQDHSSQNSLATGTGVDDFLAFAVRSVSAAVHEIVQKGQNCGQTLRLAGSDQRPYLHFAIRTEGPHRVEPQRPVSTSTYRLLISEVVESAAFRRFAMRAAEDRVCDSSGVEEGTGGVERGKPLCRVQVAGEASFAGAALELGAAGGARVVRDLGAGSAVPWWGEGGKAVFH